MITIRIDSHKHALRRPDSYGDRDPYVSRSGQDIDTRLRTALKPARMVLVVGPSKVEKTRTVSEAIRAHWIALTWPLPSWSCQQELANAVGSVRGVIARTLASLRDDGFVQTERDRVRITEPDRPVEIAASAP
jgi:hypothetical protein